MDHLLKNSRAKQKNRKIETTVSTVLKDGRIVEMLYSKGEGKTSFAVWTNGTFSIEQVVRLNELQTLVPYSANNNLLKNDVVLLPSEPKEYGSPDHLLCDIQTFIHRYVDLSTLFEQIASYYVLMSWVYEDFSELPYLRLRGDYGSGKSRTLLTVGALCYKPIFASGASTVSPLFRILDAFRGTLIIDEGDFRLSDDKAEIVKILNNGNAKGFPVLRSEVSGKGEFNPKAYAVFGPKIVATRGFFQDRALESRCITEEMGQSRLREDIPINMPPEYKFEAEDLRNKLLLFRFRNLGRLRPIETLVDRAIEPRLNQVFVPLLSMISDESARENLRDLARRFNREMVADRGMDIEAQVLEVIRDLIGSGEERPSMKSITAWFIDRYGDEYDRKVTAKWIGNVVRKRLQLKPQKSNGVFIIPVGEEPKLARLYEKYGLSIEGDKDAGR